MSDDTPTRHTVQQLQGDVLADLAADAPEARLALHTSLGGCFRLPVPVVNVELCWTFVPPKTFRVCLKIQGIQVQCLDIPVNECATFEANTPLTKLRLSVCTNANDQRICLTYEGQVCVWVPFEWRCLSVGGPIICIPI